MPCAGVYSTRTGSPAPMLPARSTRRYVPVSLRRVNRLTHCASPDQCPNVAHGTRGALTSSRVSPIDHRAPTTASLTSSPAMRRFSPNQPAGRSRPSSSLQRRASSSA
ncbi:Uncharacterised protein [Mycobacteroides abscessus subsp. abscessus]|nr:Uncharacterised protein [Mycobacteroides abscessus subsp. abscessus]